MGDADVVEILKLPVEDRLRLVELLWESLCVNPSAVPLSDAHRAAIDDELAEHRRNPEDVLTLEQVIPKVPRA
jgi:putative addiction module component (TIGR02574 family)